MAKGVLEPSYRRRVGYQAALLGGMAMFASAALVLGDLRTRDDIALRQSEDLKRSLEQVIPAGLHDNEPVADSLELPGPSGRSRRIYVARRDGLATAAAFETAGQGYSGDIRLIMGVSSTGEVLGVRVLAHAETPGLGDKIEIEKDDWIKSFDGRSLDNTVTPEWAVKKDGGRFDQFTGATITPRAVVQAVHEGLRFFRENRTAIMAETVPAQENTNE
jgi:electron transport complex protein RnfG